MSITCAKCAGEGHLWTPRLGGNDPDVRDDGPCDACEGTGGALCEYCGIRSATKIANSPLPLLLCDSCHDELMEDDIDESEG